MKVSLWIGVVFAGISLILLAGSLFTNGLEYNWNIPIASLLCAVIASLWMINQTLEDIQEQEE